MQKQTKNTILFVVLMVLCFFIWLGVKTYFAPPPPVPKAVDQAVADIGAGSAGLWQGLAQEAVLTLEGEASSPEAKPTEKPAPPPVVVDEKYKPTPIEKLTTKLGENNRTSKYHLYAVLDPHGAVIRIIVLNKDQQADAVGPAHEAAGRLAPADGAGPRRPRRSLLPAAGLSTQQQGRRSAARHPGPRRLVRGRRSRRRRCPTAVNASR